MNIYAFLEYIFIFLFWKMDFFKPTHPLNLEDSRFCSDKGRVKKSGFYHLGGGVSRGQLSLFIFFIFFVPNVLKIISRPISFFKYRGRGAPRRHLKPPYGPWQTLSVLKLTLCVVWPTFCMVGPSFCTVWPAF